VSDTTEPPGLSGPTGAQRVAAFLLSLDKDVGVEVMRHLDPKIVSEVAEAMTALDPRLCTPEALEALYQDLAQAMYQPGSVRPRDDRELREILEASFGAEEAERVLRRIHRRRQEEQPFRFLEGKAPPAIARLLAEESAMVVALVLSYISPALSAEIIGELQPETALEVVQRMTTLVPPSIETTLIIAEELERQLESAVAGPPAHDPAASLRTVAELLNFSATEIEQAVLEALERHDEQVASDVRDYMFSWENLADLDKRSMQKVLASVDTKTLSMSLKACSPEVARNVVGNLSSRVKAMVEEERDLSGPVPFSTVVDARNEILKIVRTLIESGEFSPPRAGEELVT